MIIGQIVIINQKEYKIIKNNKNIIKIIFKKKSQKQNFNEIVILYL